MVDAYTGAKREPFQINTLIRNALTNAAITSLVAASDGFYGTGQAFGRTDGNLEGAFKADWSGNRIWIEDCHGDTYRAAVDGQALYVAGHAHDCARIGGFPDTVNPQVQHHGLAFTTAQTRTLSPETGDYYNFGGQPAPSRYCTGFPGSPWAASPGRARDHGMSRLAQTMSHTPVSSPKSTASRSRAWSDSPGAALFGPNLDGPRLSAASMGLTGVANTGSIRMSWPLNNDRDNTRLTYKLYRDNVLIHTATANSTFWSTSSLSYTDNCPSTRNRTYTYKLTAADPYTNFKTSTNVAICAR